jgi:hypothetical protein
MSAESPVYFKCTMGSSVGDRGGPVTSGTLVVMRGVVLLVMASGCNSILGLPATTPYDAPVDQAPRPDAVGCSGKLFTGPDELTEFNSGGSRIEFDFTERADGKELWFSAQEPAGQTQDMHSATRAALGEVWKYVGPAPWNVDDFHDADSGMTDDGLRLVFTSDRGSHGNLHAWEVVRSSPTEAFGAPSILRGIDDEPMNGLDMTLDGLTLYFSDSSDGYQLHVAHRTSFEDLFEPEMAGGDLRIVADRAAFLSISPDELELFHSDGTTGSAIYRRIRGSPSEPFGPPALIVSSAGDAEISADSQRLYYASSGKVFVLNRSCP